MIKYLIELLESHINHVDFEQYNKQYNNSKLSSYLYEMLKSKRYHIVIYILHQYFQI